MLARKNSYQKGRESLGLLADMQMLQDERRESAESGNIAFSSMFIRISSTSQSCNYAKLSQTHVRSIDGVCVVAHAAHDTLLVAAQLDHLCRRCGHYTTVHCRGVHQDLSSRTATGKLP
jgi:hypothetical protein